MLVNQKQIYKNI